MTRSQRDAYNLTPLRHIPLNLPLARPTGHPIVHITLYVLRPPSLIHYVSIQSTHVANLYGPPGHMSLGQY